MGLASTGSLPLRGMHSLPLRLPTSCVSLGEYAQLQPKSSLFTPQSCLAAIFYEIEDPPRWRPTLPKCYLWPRSWQRQKVANFCKLLLMHVVWKQHSSHRFSSLYCALDTRYTIIMLFIYEAIINYKAVNSHFPQPWKKSVSFLFLSVMSTWASF